MLTLADVTLMLACMADVRPASLATTSVIAAIFAWV